MRKFILLLVALVLLLQAPVYAAPRTVALKGVVGNDPPSINQFHADFVIESFGLYLLDYNFESSELIIHLADLYSPLTFANIQAIAQHPNFQHRYLILREPDLNGSVGIESSIADAQMELVRSADPQALFIIEIGTVLHPPYTDTSYGKKLLKRIAHPEWLTGIGLTFYPYATPSYRNFVHKTRAWLDVDYPALGQYIVETGIVTNSPPLTNYSMQIVHDESIDTVVGWAWFSQFSNPNTNTAAYDDLEDAQFHITQTGLDFIAQ